MDDAVAVQLLGTKTQDRQEKVGGQEVTLQLLGTKTQDRQEKVGGQEMTLQLLGTNTQDRQEQVRGQEIMHSVEHENAETATCQCNIPCTSDSTSFDTACSMGL